MDTETCGTVVDVSRVEFTGELVRRVLVQSGYFLECVPGTEFDLLDPWWVELASLEIKANPHLLIA